MARRYLAIPATAASLERTFSIGSIITKLRNQMSPATAKQRILLKSWCVKDLKKFDEASEDEEEDWI